MSKDKLIIALDVDAEEKALKLVETLKNDVRFFKIGFELFSSCGTRIIDRIRQKDCDVFLDLKLHDIPNTVAKTASVLARLGVFMFNVHALGGMKMMKETVAAVARNTPSGAERPKVIAVTILTSMDDKALKETGFGKKMQAQVLSLAKLAKKSGLDGVVASVSEASLIKKELGGDFLVVTPGIRPLWAAAGDQKRIATPSAAIKNGSDFIVVGRPVTESSDPAKTARRIVKEIETQVKSLVKNTID